MTVINPIHNCAELRASDNSAFQGYGPAIDVVTEDEDGSLWAGNGEYSTRVNFCPFCGMKAKAAIPVQS